MSIQAFRDAFTRDAGNMDFGEQVTSGLSPGTNTPWFNCVPHKGTRVLGVFAKCVYVLTATGAKTPVAGSDSLDPILNGGTLDVSGGTGTANRSQLQTRPFAEFVYAATTNVPIAIAALPTFVSASTATVTVSFFIPLGMDAGKFRIKLPGAITSSSYTSAVTISYSSITTQVVSTTFTGSVAFRQELSPSLGTGLQSVMGWIPLDIAPDVAFMDAETSTTITQVLATDIDRSIAIDSADTDALQIGAAAFAPISGATYTTTAGFVMSLTQKTFASFRINFTGTGTHYMGFLQCTGGDVAIENLTPSTTQAAPAVQNQGSVTASGQVAAAGKGRGAGGMTGSHGGRRYTYGSR